ncbi:probable G-protein coupled receptor 25 [Lepisosteus oculatus]|nr:PREDICTED: probable G-protein coupled receptor 25 [Lepisosteus oculatus]
MAANTMDTTDYEYSEDDFNGSENYTYLYPDWHELLDCPQKSLPWQSVIIPTLYFLIFFTGFIGNLCVIVIMASKHKNRRLVDTFVINLAVADLVFVCTLPFWGISAAKENQWDFGDFLCKFSSYVIAVNRFSNIFFLTCMSVDRYLAVVRMLDSRYLRSNQCVRLTCCVIWLASIALGVPSLIYRRVEENGAARLCTEIADSAVFNGISLVALFLAFVLPVVIIVACYCSILVKLRNPPGLQNPKTEQRRRHSLKIVLVIIVAFVVSWLPFNVFKTILIACQLQFASLSCASQTTLARGLTLSSCFAFLNSCANPAIYIFLDHHFRHRALRFCLGWFGPQIKRRSGAPAASSSGLTIDSYSVSSYPRCRMSSVHLQ